MTDKNSNNKILNRLSIKKYSKKSIGITIDYYTLTERNQLRPNKLTYSRLKYSNQSLDYQNC
jgi:uncharacterized LabA/DUF88 family protein